MGKRLLTLKRRNEIKAKLKKIALAFKSIFVKFESEIAPLILHASLQFMQGFKKVLDSGIIDQFVELTKTDLDDNLLEKSREVSDKIIDYLLEGTECLKKETREEKLACLVAIFKSLDKQQINDKLANAHSKYLAEMDDYTKKYAFYRIKANELYLGIQTAEETV